MSPSGVTCGAELPSFTHSNQAYLLESYTLSVCWSANVFVSLTSLKHSFVWHRILVWQYYSCIVGISLFCLLPPVASDSNSLVVLMFTSLQRVTFLLLFKLISFGIWLSLARAVKRWTDLQLKCFCFFKILGYISYFNKKTNMEVLYQLFCSPSPILLFLLHSCRLGLIM